MTELENTTNTVAAATLTEKELWAQFLDTTIHTSVKFGSTTLKEEIEPYELTNSFGEFEMIHQFSEDVNLMLQESEAPAEDLDTLISDVEGYLLNLKLLRDKFTELKEATIIMPDEPDEETCSQEEYSAWESAANEAEVNPRYRAIAEDEREAA